MADVYLSEPHRYICPEILAMIIKTSKANIYATYPEEQLSPQLSTHFWNRDERSAPTRGELGVQVKAWKEGLKGMLEEEAKEVGKPELACTLIPPILEYLIEHLLLLHQEAFGFRILPRGGGTPTAEGSTSNEQNDIQDHATAVQPLTQQSEAVAKVNELEEAVQELKEKLSVADEKIKQAQRELEAVNRKMLILAAESCDEKDVHQLKTKALAKKLSIAELQNEQLRQELLAAKLKIDVLEGENRVGNKNNLSERGQLGRKALDGYQHHLEKAKAHASPEAGDFGNERAMKQVGRSIQQKIAMFEAASSVNLKKLQ